MSTEFVIRRATPDDAPAIFGTVAEGFARYRSFAPAWSPPPQSNDVARIAARLAEPEVWGLVAETAAGMPAGHVAFAPARTSRRVDADPGLAHLWMLFLREPFHATGLATRLLSAAQDEAAARGFQAMRLFTPAGQARARRFYEREGWHVVEPLEPKPDPDFGLHLAEYRRDLRSVTAVVDPAMRSYYDRRAGQYDDWWHAKGRFAERDRPGWNDDVAALIVTIEQLPPVRTLDVACGTAFLTRHVPGPVTALDQSEAMLEVARARLPEAELVRGDAVPLPFADDAFERVITAHFYGHLLPDERGAFVAEARRAGGELVVVDSALRPETGEEDWRERVLDDGSTHRVYKRWFTGAGLLAELGGDGEVLHDGPWFVVVRTRG